MRPIVLSTALMLFAAGPARAETYYVATDGSDEAGDGSAGAPFRTIGHALSSGVAEGGGDEVVVRDGVYSGQTTLTRGFAAPVLIRAEHPYQAVLTNAEGGGEAIRIYVSGPARITIEGFVITNEHPSHVCDGRESYYLIHLQDASEVTLRDNVIFGNNAPGTCNELLKINRGGEGIYPRDILIEGNLFFDSANAGGADMIDSVRPGELEIVENIFWGDPAHSSSHSFITIKRQAPGDDPSSPRYVIARNVFLNWGGATDQAFIQFGEDGVDFVEITDALIENNLFLGNSAAQQAGPIQLKGAAEVLIRANTVVGDLPSGAFCARIGTEGDNPPVSGFSIIGNLFADPTGTMSDRLINAYGQVDVASIILEGNLYWNGGQALPTGGDVPISEDAARVEGDPALEADQSALSSPLWVAGAFASGSATIREELLRLVEAYGALGATSAAVDRADPAQMPAVDIRGLPRGAAPDLGAYELGAADADGDGDVDADSDGDVDADSDADSDGDVDGDVDADSDADGDVDADSDVDADGDEGEGCGCRSAGPARAPLALLVAAALILGLRPWRER